MSERKRYLINPKFQLVFIGFMMLLCAIAVLILFFSNFYFFMKLNQMGSDLGIPANSPYFQFLLEQKKILGQITLVTSGILSLIIIFAGTLFSHRICGPLYRLEKQMDSMSTTGEIREVKFRKGDFFPELSLAFNRLVGRFGKS